MPLSPAILDILHSGYRVAAELPSPNPDMRAYVVVLPQTPDKHQHPEVWVNIDWALPRAYFVLRDSASITGYEIRYVTHKAQYTGTEYGWDTDIVLADKTTRIRRLFVSAESEVEAALLPWLADVSLLRHWMELDSSLVCCLADEEISQPDEHPHLWL